MNRKQEPRRYRAALALAVLALVVAALAGCTQAQPAYELRDVMVYISPTDSQGNVVVVPFYNLTHSGPDAANLTLEVTLSGADPATMNGYHIQPTFTDGLYQPPLNLGLNARDGENVTLRLRLSADGAQLLGADYVLQLGLWPKETWLLLVSAT